MTALRIHNTNRIIDGLFKTQIKEPSAMDILEKEKQYCLSFNMPGVRKESVDISIKDNNLTVQVKPEENTESHGKYLIRNRKRTAFRHSFQMPDDCNRESLKASLELGVLTLIIDKIPETAPRTITIQ